jgi:hypothetical protein
MESFFSEIHLVVGPPVSGKTTWIRRQLAGRLPARIPGSFRWAVASAFDAATFDATSFGAAYGAAVKEAKRVHASDGEAAAAHARSTVEKAEQKAAQDAAAAAAALAAAAAAPTAVESADEWTCDSCTLMNSASAKRCEACDVPRADTPAIAVNSTVVCPTPAIPQRAYS